MTKSNLSWRQLACLKVGGAICLPVIIAGHALCQHYGLASAVLAIIIGNLILLVMALGMAKMSVDSGLTTTDNAKAYFGPYGARCFAAALMTAKTCWIAIQLSLMTAALATLLPDEFPHSILIMSLGFLVILAAMRGITVLTKLTSLIMPLLVATLSYALYEVVHREASLNHETLKIEGISLAIATAVAAVTDMPTYFRHAKTRFDSYIAAILFIGVGVPVIESVGVYLCYMNPGTTVMDTLRQAQSPIWNAWVTIFIVLAGWSTNNSNLYSAVAGLRTIVPSLSEKIATCMIGSVGILFAIGGILNSFAFVIQLLGVAVASMGCVILTRYVSNIISSPITNFSLNLGLWGFGAVIGLLSVFKIIEITSIPLVDACAASILATVLSQVLARLLKQKIQKEPLEVIGE